MRLIDADAFRWWVDDWYDCTELGQIVTEWINDRPTIEAEPVRRGRWIEKKDFIYCSECDEGYDAIYKIDYRHCPNCGARMEDDADD